MISIVVPARNEEGKIGRLLESIEDNKFNYCEVIVVDGDSSDRTREIAQSYGAKVVEGPLQGLSAARNKGWRAAKGEWIYFHDADGKLESDTLSEIQKAIDRDKPDLVRVEVEIPEGQNFVEKVVRQENIIDLNETLIVRAMTKVKGLWG